MRATIFTLLCLLAFNCLGSDSNLPLVDFELLQTREHNTRLFTQGLVLSDDYFYESSGHYGRSNINRYPRLEQNPSWLSRLLKKDQRQKKVDRRIFAEGITLLKGDLYLLSWKAERAFIFNSNNLKLQSEKTYSGQGWGLTDNGRELIRSDGSDQLYFHNPDSFDTTRTLQVIGFGRDWNNLNELEYVDGIIWANIWRENIIIAIDGNSGQVVQVVDLTPLAEKENLKKADAVLNGIAYDPRDDALWVTGKNWKKLYQIRVKAAPASTTGLQ